MLFIEFCFTFCSLEVGFLKLGFLIGFFAGDDLNILKQVMLCMNLSKSGTDWNACPPEIIWIIFKYLDTKALTKCMLVNHKWKDVAENIAEINKLWKKIVKYEMSNKGASLIYKSRLDWRNIYKNALLWNYVRVANIKLLNCYAIKNIKKIKVYNGMFIAIDGSCATYYDMNTFKKVSQLVCVDMEENDNMLVTLTQDHRDTRQLNLCILTKILVFDQSAVHQEFKSRSRYGINGILMFKLEGNSCYSVSKDNLVTVLTSKGIEHVMELLGRCYTSDYDPIIDIHLWNEDGFLITKWGWIWSFSSLTSGIQKVHKLNVPDNVSHYNWVMFDKFSSVIPVTSNNNERVRIEYNESSGAIMLHCADLTTALAHDDVLFLGFSDGRVEIRLPKKNISRTCPERFFNIQEFSNYDGSSMIVALNVYELENSHILLACTNTKVYQFQLTYPEHIMRNV